MSILSYSDFLGEKKNPCWKGYTQIGNKKKKGKKVPNCVRINEEAAEFDRASFYLDYYRNLTPSDFKVEKYGDSIVITLPTGDRFRMNRILHSHFYGNI